MSVVCVYACKYILHVAVMQTCCDMMTYGVRMRLFAASRCLPAPSVNTGNNYSPPVCPYAAFAALN